ncbi:MAG TPA: class I SAM-dependent methyltransferase, partial [Chlamydiales bacterium]|nr:class I SAM-dependent methyltransferase [Chlamydiales bacterium]
LYGFSTKSEFFLVRSRYLNKIEGWCTDEKAELIVDLVLKTKPTVCVEIGVFGGASVIPFASALKINQQGFIYAIDPWSNAECLENYENMNDPNYAWWSKVDLNYVYHSYLAMIRKFEIIPYCKTMKMTSKDALHHISEEIDILHIDGNHSEESSSFDVYNYFPKVKKGGYVLFDDANWATTTKAYQYLEERCEIIKKVDNGNCVLFKKQ